MALAEAPAADRHPSTARFEAGTAPGDRRFRPDVEGLRAVAVVLVVLYHAGAPHLSGGYVGVDVFFVISGFVITGLLLREQAATGRTSILDFYARRVRRILPAATLVIIASVLATYVILGAVYGNPAASDARWTSVFLANFHFASTGTNYLTAHQAPSPLLNFWSLAVEEQFYLVYPTIVLVVASLRLAVSLRARLILVLVVLIGVSLFISAVETNTNPTFAYFSPFARAWELALGALVAVATAQLLRIPAGVGTAMGWIGLCAIGFAAVTFNGTTHYPGTLVAIPVVGTALVIAGGVKVPRLGVERMLKLAPFQWMGRLSYSFYLWHWPILVIAADRAGRTSLPFGRNVGWLFLGLALSVLTYALIENPARRARVLSNRRVSMALGLTLIASSWGVATAALGAHAYGASAGANRRDQPVQIVPLSASALAHLVRVAPHVRGLPGDLTPPLTEVPQSWGGPPAPCWPATGQSSVPACMFGDPHGTRTMVVYGDSHAAMWFKALDNIASLAHFRLAYISKGWCPVDELPYVNPPGWGPSAGEYSVCDRWHQFAINRIRQLKPDLVIVTQDTSLAPGGRLYSSHRWEQGLVAVLSQLGVPMSRVVVLGNIPRLPQSGPQCLAEHPSDVQACSGMGGGGVSSHNAAERQAAKQSGARYIDVRPWFCSTTCTALVGPYVVYWDQDHITAAYSVALEEVLGQSLHLDAVP